MKLTIGKHTIEEPQKYRFSLNDNKLTIVSMYNDSTIGTFLDGTKQKTIPRKELNIVRRKLTEHKRSVII